MRIFGFSIPFLVIVLTAYVLGSKFPNKIPLLNRI